MNKLQYWRSQRRLSQDELAKRSGVSKRTIQRIEGDQTEPNLITIGKLAAALEIEVTELSELMSKSKAE